MLQKKNKNGKKFMYNNIITYKYRRALFSLKKNVVVLLSDIPLCQGTNGLIKLDRYVVS